MSQQSLRQASVRAVTGTANTYEGDWHALFDLADIPAGPFNGRLLAWINQKLSASYTNLPEAQQALAAENGAFNWSSLGTFDAGGGGGAPVDETVTIRSTTNQIVDLSAALAGVSDDDDHRITLSVAGDVKAQVWPYALNEADWIGDGQSRTHVKRFLLDKLAAITRDVAEGEGVGAWTFSAPGGFSYTLSFNVDDTPPTEWDYGALSLAQYGGFPIPQFLPGDAADWAIQSQSTAGAFVISASPFYAVSFAGTAGSATRTVGTPAEGDGAYTVTLHNATLDQTHTISFNIIPNRFDVDSSNARILTTGGRPMRYGDEIWVNDPNTWGEFNNPSRGSSERFGTSGARSQRSGGPAEPTGPYVDNSWEPAPAIQPNPGWITIRPRTPWAVRPNAIAFAPPASNASKNFLRWYLMDLRNNETVSKGALLINATSNVVRWTMVEGCVSSDITVTGNASVLPSETFVLDNCVGTFPYGVAETNGVFVKGMDSQIVGNMIEGVTNDAIVWTMYDSTPGSGRSKKWFNFIRNKKYPNTGQHGDFTQIYGTNSNISSATVAAILDEYKVFDVASELGEVYFRGQGQLGDGSAAQGGAAELGKNVPDGQGSWAGDWDAAQGETASRIKTAGCVIVSSFQGGIGRKWAGIGTRVRNVTMAFPQYMADPASSVQTPLARLLQAGGKIGIASSFLAGGVLRDDNGSDIQPPDPVQENNFFASGDGRDATAFLASPEVDLGASATLEQVVDAYAPLPGGPLTVAGGASEAAGAIGTGLVDQLRRTYDPAIFDPVGDQPLTQATWDGEATPTGTPSTGNVLTAPDFGWSETVTVLKRNWLSPRATISGATSTTYTVQAGDAVGSQLAYAEWVEDSLGNRIVAVSQPLTVTA